MRFERLSLERYGRFENCALDFRPGAPDLHIVYGPNEAGKSTTLAAVSDLLFGFGSRTVYDFRFDKALLRVGGRLEEDGRTFEFRRRKGNVATLLDAEDRPVDESVLAGFLRGQTREGFRLAFSLDQQRLRQGGRAMVEAKDDVGQALFAAGSGLTDIAVALDRLNEEADAIWGRRGAKRSFAVAERDEQEAQRRVRDALLKPKAWTDARGAAERSSAALSALESARDVLVVEQRRVERIRRVGPGLRRREQLLAEIATFGDAVSIASQREGEAEAAMIAVAGAERLRAAAATLLGEAHARLLEIQSDDAVVAASDRIDDLAQRRGAYEKAAKDRIRIFAERRIKTGRIAEIEAEVGGPGVAIPTRLAMARLRDMAKRHAEAVSGMQALGGTVADLVAREKPLRDRIADATLSDGLPALVAAVDAAYRLGADIDVRCDASVREAERLASSLAAALARLSPWTGAMEDLAALSGPSNDEIAIAQDDLLGLRARQEREAADAVRLGEEAAAAALEITTLAQGGLGVTGEALISARSSRQDAWLPIARHLRLERLLDDPGAAATVFEGAALHADGVVDLRFASAQASGRLAELESRRSALELQATHARRRADGAAADVVSRLAGWNARLSTSGLPPFEPIRARAWLVERQSALDVHGLKTAAEDRARTELQSRADAIARLLGALSRTDTPVPTMAPLLEVADVVRSEGEARDAAFREDRAELREIERSLDDQRRRLKDIEAQVVDLSASWQVALDEAGVQIAVGEAHTYLAVFEELRAELDAAGQLDARLNGIDLENAQFETDVRNLAGDLGIALGDDASLMLTKIRARLVSGLEKRQQLIALLAEIERRQGEIDAAMAAKNAAIEGMAPVRAIFGLSPEDDLATAIDRSRAIRSIREELADLERQAVALADGYALSDLEEEWRSADPDDVARRGAALADEMSDLNGRISLAAAASGEANLAFSSIEGATSAAAVAAADVEQARAEMSFQAEDYLLKRTQAVMLRWAMEQYRERRQDPLLKRASELFRSLTIGRYLQLRVDLDGSTPRLGGLCEDAMTIVDVGSMSEGTTDQLFLALRLAAIEQSAAAGVRLPFLADDLFVNFDDDRAEAGFRVLAELAKSTQVLFFTHHPHLAAIAAKVVGADMHSECVYG